MGTNLKPGITVFSAYRARELFALTLFFLILAIAAVAARFYAKRLRSAKYTYDDWLLLWALFIYGGLCAGDLTVVLSAGMGHHAQDLLPAASILQEKVYVGVQWAYVFQMAAIRYSICIFLMDIFATKAFRYKMYAVMILNTAWAIFGIFQVGFLCKPFAYNWNKSIPGGHCLDENAWLAGVAGWEIVLDLVIWGLPIPIVWNLQLPRSQKVSLTAIFALGLLVVVVSIMRVVSVLAVNYSDFPYSAVSAFIWATAEPAIGILVACVPLYNPLLKKVLPDSWFHKKRSSREGGFYEEDTANVSWPTGYAKRSQRLEDELELAPPWHQGTTQGRVLTSSTISEAEYARDSEMPVVDENFDRVQDVSMTTEVFVSRTVEPINMRAGI